MADDLQGIETGSGAGATPTTGIDPAWIKGLQDYLNGKPTTYDPRQGVPPGYKIDNGQVVPESQWDQWGKGALEFFGPAALSLGVLPNIAPFDASSVAGQVGNAAVQQGTKMTTDDLLKSLFDTSSSVGQVAGNAAQGMAANNLGQAGAQNSYDSNAIRNYLAEQEATKLAAALPSIYASQVARGDTMQNAKDATISGLPSGVNAPTITGGLRPSLLGPNSQAAGAQLSKQALLNLMNPQIPKAPTLTALPQAGVLQNTLGGVGLLGSLTGALSPLKNLFTNPGTTTPPVYGPADPNPYGVGEPGVDF